MAQSVSGLFDTRAVKISRRLYGAIRTVKG